MLRMPLLHWAVLAVAALLAALAVWGLATELPRFGDPCHTWNIGSSHSETLGPGEPCQSKTGSSETAGGAALRLALVQGAILVASTLAAIGSLSGRAWPLLAAGVLMAGETVLLFFGISALFLLAAGASALYFVAGFRRRRMAVAPQGIKGA